MFLWATTLLEAHVGLVLALVVWSVTESGLGGVARVLLPLGALVVGGIHELSGVLFVVLVGARVLYQFRTRRKVSPALAAVFAAAVAGTAISILAPGNRVRAALIAETGAGHSLGWELATAASLAMRLLRTWLLTDVRFWAATVVLLVVAIRRSAGVEPAHRRRLRDLGWIGAALTLAVVAGTLIPTLALAAEMPARTEAQVLFTFLAGWSVMITAFGEWVAGTQVIGAPVLQGTQSLALVVLCLAVSADGNGREIRRAWASGRLAAWHRAQGERMRRLDAARGTPGLVVLPPVPRQAVMPSTRDSPDPDYAHNLCLAWYYDVPGVSTDTVTTR